ncbi:MAG: S9 family peptidase [Gemmatimonadota bacterium]|nr:S9 family peptidase [Gemmatimonadota bacterium]
MMSRTGVRRVVHVPLLAAITVSTVQVGCASEDAGAAAEFASVEPPVATVVPHEIQTHGHLRVDDYYWLNDRDDPDVIAYLEAENDYTDAMMAHTADLRRELFDEIKGRIEQTDLSVPVFENGYFYYSRTEDGKDYSIHARKRGSLDAPEEILIDENVRAEGESYYGLSASEVSPGNDLLAFAEDVVGRRIYTLRFKDLETGQLLADEIPGISGNVVWAEDNRTVFYTKRDPQTLRSFQIFRHELGTDPSSDALVFQEDDEEFSTFVRKTRSRDFILIGSSHTLTNEYRYLDARDPTGEFTVFLPRDEGHEHSIDHVGDHFYISTNSGGASNFRLMRTPVSATAMENWEEVIPHRDDVLLQGFTPFERHLVVNEREAGLVKLRIIPWDGSDEHYIEFDDPAYLAYTTGNPEMATSTLRFGYTSLAVPRTIYDYDMETRERTLLKQEAVLGDFDSSDYVVERLMAPARDGVEVPVSIVYRRGIEKNGTNPTLLYAYGSYGASMDATFSSSRLSLLDRGFVYAIGHIRGGQEMGRRWYEDGKMFNKMNTFTDYIDVAEFLIAGGYTTPDLLFAKGGSAGGLLMGAVANLRPDLFRGMIANVPFVDVVTTMLDESIPLTTFEYDEWGNPNDLESYNYMLSYSPYDQVVAKDYPNMLVTTGLHDSQVQYWEPAKWVAKLRAVKTDDNRLLLRTHMDAGHGGGSGRDRSYEETAFEFAFMLDLLGRGGGAGAGQ